MPKKAKGKPVAKLNKRQLAFCAEYIVDLNATQAALRAGYSKKTAYSQGQRLLKHAEVAQEIGKLKSRREKRTEINADWVLKASVALYNRCMEAEDVKDKDGNSLGMAKFHAAGAAKALELVGKHCNVEAFKEKVELSGNLQITQITRKII